MQKRLGYGIIAFMLIFAVGCKKTPDQTVDSGMMTATVNGVAFNAATCYERFSLGATEDYVITGYGNDGRTFIVINLKKSTYTSTVGDQYLYPYLGTNWAKYEMNGGSMYSQSGKVTITSDSVGQAVSGTFDFVGMDGTAVTAGSFRAVFKH
jgi:uncharacterized membrane protein